MTRQSTCSKVEPETIAQTKVVRHLRSHGVGVFSVPNGFLAAGPGKWGLINKFKSEGMENGAPDLIVKRLVVIDGKRCPVAIEMKKQSESTTDEQDAMHEELRREGWHVIVGYGSEHAILQLNELAF